MSWIVSLSMYFLSFVPLWITVLFIDIKSLCDGGYNKCTEIISIILIILGFIITLVVLLLKLHNRNDKGYTYSIQEAKECKTITAEFLLSYILPLFAFDFTRWDEIVKFLIFFMIFGYLCVRHNSFCVNIILEIMQFKLYECVFINADDKTFKRIAISKKPLTAYIGENVRIKFINNDYCFVLKD